MLSNSKDSGGRGSTLYRGDESAKNHGAGGHSAKVNQQTIAKGRAIALAMQAYP